MSRKVSKIFVICALVAIVPLMIAGTALAAIYSMDTTVFVEAVIDQDIAESAKSDTNFAHVACKEVSKDSFKIVAGRNQSAEVRADYAPNAYVFKGWFNGSKQEYQAAKEAGNVQFISTDTAYTFQAKGVSNLVAAYEAVRFDNVSYQYKANPTDEQNTSKAPSDKTSFVYGEELPVLETEDEGYSFAGWKIWGEASVDALGAVRYNTATFDLKYATNEVLHQDGSVAQTLRLTDPWLKGDFVIVSFYDLDKKVISQDEIIKGNAYTVPSVEEVLTAAGKTDLLEEGYTYFWADAQGQEIGTSVDTTANVDIYLARKENTTTFTVTYFDLNNQELSHVSVNKNENVILADITEVLTAAGKESQIEKGYTYFWGDVEGNQTATTFKATQNVNVYLRRNVVEYTAKLQESQDGTFEGENTVKFSVESDAKEVFAAWMNAENWTMKYSFWKFDGIKNGENVYTADNISEFVNEFIQANDATVVAEFELNVHKYFTSVKVYAFTIGARATSADSLYLNKVYTKDTMGRAHDFVLDYSTNGVDSTTSLMSFLRANATTYYTKIGGVEKVVTLTGISASGFALSGESLKNVATLNDLIELILAYKPLQLGSTLAISNLTLGFTVA